MVWVFGNSHERVPIKDLNDIIYFRQKKQYTDQEFEKSSDLKRAIQTGKIVQLEHKPEIRNSLPDNVASEPSKATGPTIDIHEIKRVVSEVLAENKPEGLDVRDFLTNLIPILSETVRQEVSKMSVQNIVHTQASTSTAKTGTFVGPEYVPNINVEGMKSSISIESKQAEGSGVADSLNALRNLGK